jgi:hypothetical protein
MSVPIKVGPKKEHVFDRLLRLEKELKKKDKSSASEPNILSALRDRGDLHTTFGMARRAKRDLRMVLSQKPDDPQLLGLLAEAGRVFARDFSLVSADDPQAVLKELRTESIDLFSLAIKRAETANVSGNLKAWLHAHRAAAYAFAFFLQPDQTFFQQAQKDFDVAKGLRPQYVWAIQFEGFLYALKGEPGDFEKARQLLGTIQNPDTLTQSAIKRSLAMLHAYDQNEPAARESIKNGLEAVSLDSEDATAAYFAASSLAWLKEDALAREGQIAALLAVPARTEEQSQKLASLKEAAGTLASGDLEELLEAALESARVRAMNAISQASAVLAGIDLLKGNQDTAQQFLETAHSKPKNNLEVRMDLETRAMITRDPVWKKMMATNPLYKDLATKKTLGVAREFTWQSKLAY